MIRKVIAMPKLICTVIIVLAAMSSSAMADKPIAIDSRIKTFVYSENEVFRIVVQYGYQTSIEFGTGEEIQTISVGNTFAWQLTPVGRRLFIRPLEENILTNMTIITNKRAYQLEIQSRALSYTVDEDLVYVVRFFYPDDAADSIKPNVIDITEQDPIPVVKPFNFNYTLSGPERIAPLKVFDDGINTFFEFHRDSNIPVIKVVDERKKSTLQPRQKGKYIVVNTIGHEFELSDSVDTVKVYNEDYKK